MKKVFGSFQVRAGLRHILIGVERAEDDNLKGLDKLLLYWWCSRKSSTNF